MSHTTMLQLYGMKLIQLCPNHAIDGNSEYVISCSVLIQEDPDFLLSFVYLRALLAYSASY